MGSEPGAHPGGHPARRPPVRDHDHAAHSLYPACDLTLFIEIDVDFGDQRTTARAIALGAVGARIVVEHGRDWRVTWRASDLDGFARGVPTVRTDAQVPVARREGRPARRADG